MPAAVDKRMIQIDDVQEPPVVAQVEAVEVELVPPAAAARGGGGAWGGACVCGWVGVGWGGGGGWRQDAGGTLGQGKDAFS